MNIKVLNNKYQITESQLSEDHITFIKIKLYMKKAILIGLIAGITGLAIGYKIPKDKNVGYVIIFGRITNLEQAGKYFA